MLRTNVTRSGYWSGRSTMVLRRVGERCADERGDEPEDEPWARPVDAASG